MNEVALFLPETAVKYNLVDTLGRWEDINDLISDFEGENKVLIAPHSLAEFQLNIAPYSPFIYNKSGNSSSKAVITFSKLEQEQFPIHTPNIIK